MASPARKNRSARRSACVIESFPGARCCAVRATAEAMNVKAMKALMRTGILRARIISVSPQSVHGPCHCDGQENAANSYGRRWSPHRQSGDDADVWADKTEQHLGYRRVRRKLRQEQS